MAVLLSRRDAAVPPRPGPPLHPPAQGHSCGIRVFHYQGPAAGALVPGGVGGRRGLTLWMEPQLWELQLCVHRRRPVLAGPRSSKHRFVNDICSR